MLAALIRLSQHADADGELDALLLEKSVKGPQPVGRSIGYQVLGDFHHLDGALGHDPANIGREHVPEVGSAAVGGIVRRQPHLGRVLGDDGGKYQGSCSQGGDIR